MDNLVYDLYDAFEDLTHILCQCSVVKDTWSLLLNAIRYAGVFESIEDIQALMSQNHSL